MDERKDLSRNEKLLINGTTILDTLLEKQQETIETQGKILGELQTIKKDYRSHTHNAIRLRRQFEKHLEAHESDPKIMGVVPFLQQYGRKNWKIFAILLVLALLINVGVGLNEMLAAFLGR